MSAIDHIVWDNSVEGTEGQLYPALRFRCRNCGDVYDLATPCPIRIVSAASKAWIADHRRCRPRPERKATDGQNG